jgi:choline dehydrogenase-like flavoprotein
VKILVIGSGPSGLHFALSALRKNHTVTILDVGTQRPLMALPEENFVGLKARLDNAVTYFLGEKFEAAVLPSKARYEYLNLPAAKDYVFKTPQYFRYRSEGMSPFISFTTGGLAEAWTGGCYPLNEKDLNEFPFAYDDIGPYYGEVARRIGVSGEVDDLAEFYPVHEHLSPPLALDQHSAALIARYKRRRQALHGKHDIRIGHSRRAVLAEARNGRNGCRYCGRCLWGCPNGALYTPSLTLRDCARHANFDYRPGFFASHFHLGGSNPLIDHLVAYAVEGRRKETLRADAYVLAGGTLSSSNLLLRTVYRSTGETIRFHGLMDNRQVLAPFVNLGMLGRSYDPDSYQYHPLALAMLSEQSEQHIHGQITPLTTATIHPIIQSLPLDLRSAASIFSDIRSCLGVLNLSFSDRRREHNYVTLERNSMNGSGCQWPQLYIHYAPDMGEQAVIDGAMAKLRRFFLDLRAPIIPGLTRWRPMGSSVHYSGTLPMAREKKSWCVSENCQSYDIQNLFVVDGAVMPHLPAKNLTFTLMANAIRVAEKAF